jgi:hypothetical protein
LKLGRKSKTFYVFDTETGIQHRNGKIEYILSARPENLIFGVVYGADGFYKVISSPKDFKREFKKKRYKNKIVYAHNAEYDLSCVYGNIYDMDREAIFNGKFISCTNGNCFFADSFNLLPTSVKKLGEILGMPKGELGDSNLMSHVRRIQKDINYCHRDCEIVYKSLENLFKDCEPCYTIGSLALKIFRAKYLKRTIKINKHSDKFFDALYGGRTEAFKIGKVNAHVYDINSAYVSVMAKNKFPNPAKLKYITFNDHIEYSELIDTHEGMVTANVYVDPSESLPVLPFRQDNRLIFPCGNFTGSWTFTEIRYALKNSKTKIKKIYEIIYAPAIESPFGEFAQDVWNKRQAAQKIGDKATDYREKLFGNNLWGKTAQQAKEEYRYCSDHKEAKEFMRRKHIRSAEIIPVHGGFFLRYENHKIFAHTIACWASYITAYVRIMLHKDMRKDGNKLVYCDTDSRFVEKVYKYTSGKLLGGWKKEEKKVVKIRALKDYVYTYYDEKEEKIKKAQMLKGVKKDSEQLDPEANAFLVNRMIRTRESMRRVDGLPPGTFIKQLKTLTGDYKKRTILKDGNTKPFVL